ncbi:hypothetical protein [Succinimonas amylolytica]|uniref:hypothetical protein n=1 Tax=Succinimonas amylolytica TaxID=83769 RepID=UPI0023A8F761
MHDSTKLKTRKEELRKVACTKDLYAWRRIFWKYFILGYSSPRRTQEELNIKDRQYSYETGLLQTYYKNSDLSFNTGSREYECFIDLGISVFLRKNPFFSIFLSKNITENEFNNLFSILLVLNDGARHSNRIGKSLRNRSKSGADSDPADDDTEHTGETTIIRQLFQTGTSGDSDKSDKRDKALENMIAMLTENGVITEFRQNAHYCEYALSDTTVRNIFITQGGFSAPGSNSVPPLWLRHLKSFLNFFSLTGYFGELGYYIENALRNELFNGREIRILPDDRREAGTFKHAFCAQNLNDEIAWYLLRAIKQRQIVELTVLEPDEALYTYSDHNKILVYMLPARIITSCTKGRRYIFGYIVSEKPFLKDDSVPRPLRTGQTDSILLDSIVDIRPPETPEISVPSGIVPADLYSGTIKWGTRTRIKNTLERELHGTEPEHLEMDLDISIDPENESDRDAELNHSVRRLRRECRNGKADITGISGNSLHGTYRTSACDEDELQSWVKTYIGRISGLRTRRQRFRKIFLGDLDKMLQIYGLAESRSKPEPPPEEETAPGPEYSEDSGGRDPDNSSRKTFKTPRSDPGIFSEYYGIYTEITRRILNHCFRIRSYTLKKDDIRRIIANATDDSGLSYQVNERYKKLYAELLFPDFNDGKDTAELSANAWFHLRRPVELPLTRTEISWLFTALSDPLAELFFDHEEFLKIRERILPFLRTRNPEEIWPPGKLFDRNAAGSPFVIIDADLDCDPVLEPVLRSPERLHGYISNFRRIRKAIEEKRFVRIAFTSVQTGKSITVSCAPIRLEFSLKNAKFRLFCISGENRVTTINIATITSTTLLESCPWDPGIADTESFQTDQSNNLCFAVVRVSRERNSIVRFLTEFSYYDKRACYDEETDTCLVKILYPDADWRETLIRILGFGSTVKLEPGQKFTELLARKKIPRDKGDFSPAIVSDNQDNYQKLRDEIRRRLERQRQLYSAELSEKAAMETAGTENGGMPE